MTSRRVVPLSSRAVAARGHQVFGKSSPRTTRISQIEAHNRVFHSQNRRFVVEASFFAARAACLLVLAQALLRVTLSAAVMIRRGPRSSDGVDRTRHLPPAARYTAAVATVVQADAEYECPMDDRSNRARDRVSIRNGVGRGFPAEASHDAFFYSPRTLPGQPHVFLEADA